MGRIYFNINNEQINYLEENMVSVNDLLLSDLSGKIVLSSMNNIKSFPCFDPFKSNQEVIQNLIKTGYKPVNKFMSGLITQNYSFCPHCGVDIDIERDSRVLILDSGINLCNLTEKQVNPFAKELSCLNCGHSEIYYYDIFADLSDKNAFVKRAIENGAEIYVKYRFLIGDNNKKAWIPIIFDFGQFIQLFNKDESKAESDMVRELNKRDDKNIIRMLFNKELHSILKTKNTELSNDIKVELKPIEIGKYNQYVTKKDFDIIQIYSIIGDDQEKLKELVLS